MAKIAILIDGGYLRVAPTVITDSGVEQIKSMRRTVGEVMAADASASWTAQMMIPRLRAMGFKLEAKNPITGVQLAMALWEKRGKVQLVRRGTGRAPNVYRWKTGAVLDDSAEDGM